MRPTDFKTSKNDLCIKIDNWCKFNLVKNNYFKVAFQNSEISLRSKPPPAKSTSLHYDILIMKNLGPSQIR